MQDLRKWRENPSDFIEWLSGNKWGTSDFLGEPDEYELYVGSGMFLYATAESFLVEVDSKNVSHGRVGDDGVMNLHDAMCEVSDYAIQSRAVWRTPDGYDLILGRWPTDEELEMHTEWTGHIGVVTPRLRSHTLEWRRDIGQDAPLYLVPLRPDGLPGILGGE